MNNDQGWRTAPDGSVNRIVAPHGIHGGEMIETLPLARGIADTSCMPRGHGCGVKPNGGRDFYRIGATGELSPMLVKRRQWRKCKRASTQTKTSGRLPRGERY